MNADWVLKQKVLLYGSLAGALLLVFRVVEHHVVVERVSIELYAALIAGLFLVLGAWVGYQTTQEKTNAHDPTPQALPSSVEEPDLSAREQEVLQLMADGLSNREIGERLFISENTVKTHVAHLFVKLDVKRRTQAIRKAREQQLLSP